MLMSIRTLPLPALPPAAARTLNLLRHACLDPVQVVRSLEAAPGWAAEVLRQACSPLWELPAADADVTDLPGLLGLRRFTQLVMVSAAGPLLHAPAPAYGLRAGELWEHAMETAIVTREIQREKGLKPCDESFTAALLHDAGKLVLGTALDVALDSDAEDPLDAERRASGLDHAEAGAALLEHWKYPFWLVQAVRAHHEPSDGSFLIADLLGLAEELLHRGRTVAGCLPDAALRWTLSVRSVDRILGRTADALDEIRAAA